MAGRAESSNGRWAVRRILDIRSFGALLAARGLNRVLGSVMRW